MGSRQVLFGLIIASVLMIASCGTKKSVVSERKENIVLTDSSHVSEKNSKFNITDIRKDSVASVESSKRDCTIIVVNDTGRVIYKESFKVKYVNRYVDRIKTIYVKDSTSAFIDTTKVVASNASVEDTKIIKKEDKSSIIINDLICIASVAILLTIAVVKIK